ncbi:uncharacterized protein LOC124943088 [Impatiens glandulifera]|uniref:uncharacterized protein LOC124943088 n=1 Tax=Impatiens glandulifera TaxID=253017 RepID=UPI001FB05F6F|nr:uncharacterized protein LOC124943088 [Impatiens glandulifera]
MEHPIHNPIQPPPPSISASPLLEIAANYPLYLRPDDELYPPFSTFLPCLAPYCLTTLHFHSLECCYPPSWFTVLAPAQQPDQPPSNRRMYDPWTSCPLLSISPAIKGPFPWIGDILPTLPDFSAAWNTTSFHPINDIARILPIPAIILDQLYAFSQFPIHANQTTTYATFEWYRCIFSQGVDSHNLLLRMGPQLCGTDLTSYSQLLGFVSQDNVEQIEWFQHIAMVMQKYASYFNESVPLKSVLTNGIGAVAIVGRPNSDFNVSNWIYPNNAMIEPFLTGRFNPRREIPSELRVIFSHSYHEFEEVAEQYAVITHTNMCWGSVFEIQNGFVAINESVLRQGDYWNMGSFRYSRPVGLKIQFSMVIASRYHQEDE